MIRQLPKNIIAMTVPAAEGNGFVRYSLKGEVSCKKNENKFNRKTGRVYKTGRFVAWHRDAMLQVLSQGVPRSPIKLYEARFVLYHGTRRRVDSDNQVSSLLDLLQDARVVADDCWTCVPKKVIEDVYRKGRPGADIVIVPITEARA